MTTTSTLPSASLYFREGASDKQYHAAIESGGEGHPVTFAYGRRGTTLTTGSKTTQPVSLAGIHPFRHPGTSPSVRNVCNLVFSLTMPPGS